MEISEKCTAGRRIREAAARGALSHALLFTGGEDRHAAAELAAAAMECTAPEGKPCGVCPACRKVAEHIHPDVTVVRDEQHRLLSAEVVRGVRAAAWISPNEGARRVFLFPDCSLLTEQDQNILLKVVEEGPPRAAFLFCAESAGEMLRTLRSRCVEVKLPPSEEREDRFSQEGEALCRAAAKRGAVTEIAVAMERRKIPREDLAAILAWCREAFAAALKALYGGAPGEEYKKIAPFLAKNLTKRQIVSTIELLQKYIGDCARPVGIGHITGALAAEWEELL